MIFVQDQPDSRLVVDCPGRVNTLHSDENNQNNKNVP